MEEGDIVVVVVAVPDVLFGEYGNGKDEWEDDEEVKRGNIVPEPQPNRTRTAAA